MLFRSCKNLVLAYKINNSQKQGLAKVYVDDVLLEDMLIESLSFETSEYVSVLDGNRSNGYNNAWVAVLLSGEEVCRERNIKIEILDEDKDFTILAFGYNQ